MAFIFFLSSSRSLLVQTLYSWWCRLQFINIHVTHAYYIHTYNMSMLSTVDRSTREWGPSHYRTSIQFSPGPFPYSLTCRQLGSEIDDQKERYDWLFSLTANRFNKVCLQVQIAPRLEAVNLELRVL